MASLDLSQNGIPAEEMGPIERLCESIGTATGLSKLELSFARGTLRDEDCRRLAAAADRSWERRARLVLLGTATASESPLAVLPVALGCRVLELVAETSRLGIHCV